MVDNSGSTTTTDPNYADRVKTVAAFLATYGSNTNFTYSYSYFGSSVQTFDFASGNFSATPTEVFANGSQAPSALNTFVTEVPGTDAGGNTTNYLPALWALTAMVLEDANTNPGQQYVAVFMSDGQPGDITGGVAQLASLVTNFVTVVRGANITLSSVYFGPETDTTSIANLTTMASSGGGVFVDTNKTTNLSIDSLITLLPSACE